MTTIKNTHERITAVGDAWIKCRSHSYEGRAYYFNTLTGESLWNLSSEDISKARSVDKPNHAYPEPSVPPTESVPVTQPSRNDNPTPLEISQALWRAFPLTHSVVTQAAPVAPMYSKFSTNRAHTYVETMANPMIPQCAINPLMPFPWSMPTGFYPPQPMIPMDEDRVSVHNTKISMSKRFQLISSDKSNKQPTSVKEIETCPMTEPQVKVSIYKSSHTPEKNISINLKVNDLRQVLKAKRQLKDLTTENQSVEASTANNIEPNIDQDTIEDNLQDMQVHSPIDEPPDENYEPAYPFAEDRDDTESDDELSDVQWIETNRLPYTSAVRIDLSPLKHHLTDGEWYLAPDTNVLISHPALLDVLVHSDPTVRLLMARRVDEELQLAARGAHGARGARGARAACLFVERMFHEGQAVTDEQICIATGVSRPSDDEHVLEFCMKLVKSNLSVVFLSNDPLLRDKAQFSDILAFNIDELKRFLQCNRSSYSAFEDSATVLQPINVSFSNTPTYALPEHVGNGMPMYSEQRVLVDASDVSVKSNGSTNSTRNRIVYDKDDSKVNRCDAASVKSNSSSKSDSKRAQITFRCVNNIANCAENNQVTNSFSSANYPTKVAITAPLASNDSFRPNVKPITMATVTKTNERSSTKNPALTNKVAPTVREPATKAREPSQPNHLQTQTSHSSDSTDPNAIDDVKRRIIRLKTTDRPKARTVQKKPAERKSWRRRPSTKGEDATDKPRPLTNKEPSQQETILAGQSEPAKTSPQSCTSDAALKRVTRDVHRQTVIEESPTNSDVISNSECSYDARFTSGATSGAISGASSEAISGATSGTIGGAARGATSGAISGATSEAPSEAISGAPSEAISGATSGVISGATSGAGGGDRAEYGITDDGMEASLRTRRDEWLSRFVHIMEDTLGQVLRSVSHPAPVSLGEAAECVARAYGPRGAAGDAAARFRGTLAAVSDGRGNIKQNVSPIEFMDVFRHGVNLVSNLATTERTEDLRAALWLLSRLLADIKDPRPCDDAAFAAGDAGDAGDIGDAGDDAGDTGDARDIGDDVVDAAGDTTGDAGDAAAGRSVHGASEVSLDCEKTKTNGRDLFDDYNTGNSFETPYRPTGPTVKFVRSLNLNCVDPFRIPPTNTKQHATVEVTPDLNKNVNNPTDRNKDDSICTDKYEGPKFLRSFTLNPAFEERLKQNGEFGTNAVDYTSDKYRTESFVEMQEYHDYNSAQYQDDYNDDKYYETVPFGSGTDSVRDRSRSVQMIIKIFLKELKAVFSAAKTFCQDAYADLERATELSESRKSTLRSQSQDYVVVIRRLVDSLTCILERESAPNDNVANILMKNANGVTADSSLLHYRDTVGKCRSLANILLTSLGDLAAELLCTPVYLSRLHHTTTAQDVAEYIRAKTNLLLRVVPLESRHNASFKAFVARVPTARPSSSFYLLACTI